jgi:tetratricopeptide (TPR) repeat protein
LVLGFLTVSCWASEKITLDSLNCYLSLQPEFDRIKENKIHSIKKQIQQAPDDPVALYPLYIDLYEEYQFYIYDSAYVCVKKLLDISSALNDREKIVSSNIKMGFCYLFSGLFKESFDILTQLNISDCNVETKIDYYNYKSRLYYDLADYNNGAEFWRQYNEKGNAIIDSAILLLTPGTSRYWASVGLKLMKSDNDRGALKAFRKILNARDYSEHDLAIATSSVAYIFRLQGQMEESKEYLIQAAIADIRSCTKETVALRNLAQTLYEEGDIIHAAQYIRRALKDASFYNARHRQLEIGHILPIIEEERTNLIQKQKDRISVFLILSSVLLVLLVIAFFIIWKQLKRLHQAQRIIQQSNEDLTVLNSNLTEANKIKDEYIGYFFSQNSEFIDKLEAFQKWVDRKVLAKQYEDLKNIPKGLNAQREREELYSRFDQIFLKMFPDFVKRFNDLLNPEEQILLKKGELLNTDLRIYALLRLGIRDNEKIAQFLGYSVNTIYTYKTKVKNKMCVPYEEFKQKIMEIKSI